MYFLIIFLSMIFMHIVDDYYLQGKLAQLKQNSFWKNKNNYNFDPSSDNYMSLDNYMHKCRFDHYVALFMHSFSWTFMINIPMVLNSYYRIEPYVFAIEFITNLIIHMVTDDLKANAHEISLLEDQTVHILQIIITFGVFASGFMFYK